MPKGRHPNRYTTSCAKCGLFLPRIGEHTCKPPVQGSFFKYSHIRKERDTATRAHYWGPWPWAHGTNRDKRSGLLYQTYEAVPPAFKRALRCEECGRVYDPPNGNCPGSPDGRPYRVRARDTRLATRSGGDRLFAVHLMGEDAVELE